ncbi:hypothetical protein A7D17_03800 [Xanthomonas floridensis]|uniref:Uncharacterized protein n=1 Tax=Xanthomonas floridensis TaxID=1843580 RepID=A0A1A9M8N1_9XANT|nr:hypothetical protein A7D17_03800 [Xanthomonas floridensis]
MLLLLLLPLNLGLGRSLLLLVKTLQACLNWRCCNGCRLASDPQRSWIVILSLNQKNPCAFCLGSDCVARNNIIHACHATCFGFVEQGQAVAIRMLCIAPAECSQMAADLLL